jgi:hypothetical protein
MINLYKLNATAYVDPDISKKLTGIGLGNLAWSTSLITVRVDHSYYPMPKPIAPVFLTGLRSVSSLVVVECSPCLEPSYPLSATSVLTGLPGLTNLYQVDAGLLYVRNTLFTDLTSFAGLTCAPQFLTFDDNQQLASFRGLDLLSSRGSLGVKLSAALSGPFTTAEALRPVKVLGGCYDSVAIINNSSVKIPVGCGKLLTTWQDVCSFSGSPSPCPPG